MTVPKDAVSAAPPYSGNPSDKPTALQSHVAFFDRDQDGIIWPRDTFVGFRAIGFGILFSVFSTLIIHGSFSWFTFGTLLPDPFFRLKVSLMHRGKHGSDTEAYNTLGEFDESRFNSVFNMYSAPPHTHLSFSEGVRMIHGNRNPFDFFGWFAAVFEWYATYIMISPADGRLKRVDVHDVFDGSIFYRLSKQRANPKWVTTKK